MMKAKMFENYPDVVEVEDLRVMLEQHSTQ